MIINEESVLHWYVGDGSAPSDTLLFCTHCFTLSENQFLANRLKKVGINAKPAPYKQYYILQLTNRASTDALFDYLELAPKDTLRLAKQLFPWKFHRKIRKKDYYDPDNNFVDPDYLETYLRLLKQSGVNLSERKEQLHHLFPWIYPHDGTTSVE